MNKNKIAIKLVGLEKFHKLHDGKKEYVFKNVYLDIPANKNIGVLGRNGAGKSTLLRIFGGIDFPNGGKIITEKTFSWVLALSGGFQGSLSGYDNAKFVARIYGVKEKDLDKKINSIKEFSELNKFFYEPVKTYSSGMKAKLGFAISIFFDFDYYLIDETISVGDANFRKKCEFAINELLLNKNIIMVSHDLNVMKRMCDIILLVDNQTIIKYDNVEEGIKAYQNLL
jgi:capsular polysaccharide transport system ATP-binding protein